MTVTPDRERLVVLLNALDASETALRRDPPIRGQEDTGDWAIWGRDDNDDSNIPIGMSCHVYPDGDAYLIYFTVADADKSDRAPSSLPWKNAKAKLSFCQVTQDGDWEGCLRLDRLPTAAEAEPSGTFSAYGGDVTCLPKRWKRLDPAWRPPGA